MAHKKSENTTNPNNVVIAFRLNQGQFDSFLDIKINKIRESRETITDAEIHRLIYSEGLKSKKFRSVVKETYQ